MLQGRVLQGRDYRFSNIQVYWDLENCGIPSHIEASVVYTHIEQAIRGLGLHGPISVRCIVAKPESTPNRTCIDLIRSEVQFHIFYRGRQPLPKQVADQRIEFEANNYITSQVSPGLIVLISSDGGFAKLLCKIHRRNYKIVVFGKPNNQTSKQFFKTEATIRSWEDVVNGVLNPRNLRGRGGGGGGQRGGGGGGQRGRGRGGQRGRGRRGGGGGQRGGRGGGGGGGRQRGGRGGSGGQRGGGGGLQYVASVQKVLLGLFHTWGLGTLVSIKTLARVIPCVHALFCLVHALGEDLTILIESIHKILLKHRLWQKEFEEIHACWWRRELIVASTATQQLSRRLRVVVIREPIIEKEIDPFEEGNDRNHQITDSWRSFATQH